MALLRIDSNTTMEKRQSTDKYVSLGCLVVIALSTVYTMEMASRLTTSNCCLLLLAHDEQTIDLALEITSKSA